MQPVIRFDHFEVNLSLGHLLRGNVRVHLRDQSFQMLAMLLERPGEVVTRDELRRRLWGEDVFVDFENGLNTAASRLREALGDSSTRPRFIDTLPKRGYRFIGRVTTPPPCEAGGPPRPRLLVLPFVSEADDPAQEHLCDAMTDEFITAMACLAPEHLAVIARTTAMHYKHTPKDIAGIGCDLGVDYVVEGTVRRTGERLVINVQLVQTSDQTHLFAKRCEADLDDIFDTQLSIAREMGLHIPSVADQWRADQAKACGERGQGQAR